MLLLYTTRMLAQLKEEEEEEDGAEDWMEDASFGICVIRLHVIFSIFHGLERHAIFNQTRDWIGLRTFRVKPKL